MTKKYKNKRDIFFLLSIFSTLLPLFVYTIKAIFQGSEVEKFTFGCLIAASIIICIINIMMKLHLRSAVWLMLLGIYVCLDKITGLLIILAICTIADELLFTPLFKKYNNLYIINREIDKR